MSSHHFVKEDQEPAVLIADASLVLLNLVEQLLEWSPTVVVLEQALDVVLSWGIKVDVVVGEAPNEQILFEKVREQAPVKIITHHSGELAFQTAMYFLRAGKYRAVNVVGMPPERLEEFATHMDIVCFDETKRWCFARTGTFEKWYASGTVLVISTNEFSAEGLSDQCITIRDGIVKIASSRPFWVGEDYS